jgi:hypothetical protein
VSVWARWGMNTGTLVGSLIMAALLAVVITVLMQR